MHALDLKVPPLVVWLVVAALMWFVSRETPPFAFAIPAGDFIAGGLALAGTAMAVPGIAAFWRAKTTILPMKPDAASSLVTSGVYRRSRNPMYVGLLLVLAGWASFLSNALAFLFLPAFVSYMNCFQIEPEERALTARFGQDFTAYKSRVRRWL